MKKTHIVHRLVGSYGSDESSEVNLVVDLISGESKLEIKKTITESYPVTDYDKVMNLHERISGGGGRRVLKLKDFLVK